MPAEAPVAPPPAAPATPTPQHQGIPEPAGSEAFAALDALATDRPDVPEPKSEAPEKPAVEKPRGQDGKFAKTEPKPDTKPETKAPESEKPTTTPPEKLAPKQLREAYEALQAKHKALEAEHAKVKSQPADDPEKKTLAERLEAREKRLKELEDEFRFVDYSKSEEYKAKFEKPFVDAYMNAQSKVANMKVVERKNELDEVSQQGRQATAEDFNTLMRISDDDQAAEWAEKMFGSKAPMVLFHRERVQELNGARHSAIEEYRKNGTEREKSRAEQQEKFVKEFTSAIDNHSKAATEKYPHFFKPDEADPQGNEALERGQYLVQRVLANGAPVKEGDKPMTNEQLASAIAAVRQKAGAFDRLAMRHSLASKRIKELETELQQYKSSEPGAGDGKGSEPSGDDESLDSALSKLDKMAREG